MRELATLAEARGGTPAVSRVDADRPLEDVLLDVRTRVWMRSETTAAGASGSVSRRPLVVELVGTPGSGKTTLARTVVDILREHGIHATTNSSRRHDRVRGAPRSAG